MGVADASWFRVRVDDDVAFFRIASKSEAHDNVLHLGREAKGDVMSRASVTRACRGGCEISLFDAIVLQIVVKVAGKPLVIKNVLRRHLSYIVDKSASHL